MRNVLKAGQSSSSKKSTLILMDERPQCYTRMNVAAFEACKQRKRCRAENRIVRWNAGHFMFSRCALCGSPRHGRVRLMGATAWRRTAYRPGGDGAEHQICVADVVQVREQEGPIRDTRHSDSRPRGTLAHLPPSGFTPIFDEVRATCKALADVSAASWSTRRAS